MTFPVRCIGSTQLVSPEEACVRMATATAVATRWLQQTAVRLLHQHALFLHLNSSSRVVVLVSNEMQMLLSQPVCLALRQLAASSAATQPSQGTSFYGAHTARHMHTATDQQTVD